MDRRRFLAGTLTLPWLAALGACRPGPATPSIYFLESSLPLRLIKGFQQESEARMTFVPKASLAALFQQLQAWQAEAPQTRFWKWQRSQPRAANWVTLGDAWLATAIQQSLIQPLPAAVLSPLLDPDQRWLELVRRDRQGQPSAGGDIWGVPYRWGSLLMVYSRQQAQAWNWQPQSWQDLWRPELRQKLLLPAPLPITYGILLKALGHGANDWSALDTPALLQRLKQLRQQARGYSSDHYLEPLVLGDVALAVGWSTDIVPFLQEYRQFAAVAPVEGSLLTADMWVQPATASQPPLAASAAADQAWIDYCLRPETATAIAISGQGASPQTWHQPMAELPASLPHRELLTLTPDLIRRSDFLWPVDAATTTRLHQLWESARPD